MRQQIKHFLCSIDRVHNNKDTFDVGKIGSLINIISYHKEFSFSSHNINCMVYSLDNWSVMDINMCYQYGNLILDTCICYYNNQIWI